MTYRDQNHRRCGPSVVVVVGVVWVVYVVYVELVVVVVRRLCCRSDPNIVTSTNPSQRTQNHHPIEHIQHFLVLLTEFLPVVLHALVTGP